MSLLRKAKVTLVLLALVGLALPAIPRTALSADGKQKNEPVFLAEGLHYEDILTAFFRGEFVDIPFDRDESTFVILFDAYIKTFASHCTASLPEDRIELTRQECASERVTTNGYGAEVGRECTRWRTVPTGLFASPEMFQANAVIEGLQAGDAFRTVFRMLTQENPMGSALGMVADAQASKADMVTLLKVNGCDSPGLKRFEENLRRFALNKQPIVLGGDPAGTKAEIVPENQDLGKLVDDLVFEHSKKWVMNKYQRGSVSNVSLSSRDAEGRPSELTAKYKFQGFTGQSVGSVRITFSDGLPKCLYFFDFPRTCRTADRRIVAGYANGSYQKQ